VLFRRTYVPAMLTCAAKPCDSRGACDRLWPPQLTAASAAQDRFLAIHAQIVTLSRRNSNVRSLALSFGRKRMVTAECEDQLQALEEALAKHEFSATR
jgi:hypothetical protein